MIAGTQKGRILKVKHSKNGGYGGTRQKTGHIFWEKFPLLL